MQYGRRYCLPLVANRLAVFCILPPGSETAPTTATTVSMASPAQCSENRPLVVPQTQALNTLENKEAVDSQAYAQEYAKKLLSMQFNTKRSALSKCPVNSQMAYFSKKNDRETKTYKPDIYLDYFKPPRACKRNDFSDLTSDCSSSSDYSIENSIDCRRRELQRVKFPMAPQEVPSPVLIEQVSAIATNHSCPLSLHFIHLLRSVTRREELEEHAQGSQNQSPPKMT